MKISIPKLKSHGAHLFLQPGLAVIYVAFILFVLNIINQQITLLWAIGVGALSSSCYIIFVTPTSPVARPKRIIGGYFIGTFCGLVMHVILTKLYLLTFETSQISHSHLFWISAAITVGLSMFMMIALNVAHPPAIGVSLVLVLNLQDYTTLILIFLSACLLALIRWLLRNWLINLV